jgi:hypothetical protein
MKNMRAKIRNTLKMLNRWIWISLFLFVAWALRGCWNGANYVQQMGFPLANSDVVYQRAYQWIDGDNFFMKARLTRSQATALNKGFQTQSKSQQMTLNGIFTKTKPDDPQWTPRTSGHLWHGSFDKQFQGYLYSCDYAFDPAGPDSVVLYFHTYTFFPSPVNDNVSNSLANTSRSVSMLIASIPPSSL